MTEKEKAASECWKRYRDTNPPVGQAQFYYKDNAHYFKCGVVKGWEACIQHLIGKSEEFKEVAVAESYHALVAAECWLPKEIAIGLVKIQHQQSQLEIQALKERVKELEDGKK
jgi:hypothetical protein